MFIPLHDGNPIKHVSLQWVTLAIIALNVIIYLAVNVVGIVGSNSLQSATIAFGHVPSVGNELRVLPAEYEIIPPSAYYLTLLTSAFLHGDFWHLAGNMLFLWVFGDNVEDALGHLKFIIFYIACAMAAAWFHALSFPASDNPLIGASGAAAGVVAAYLMLHPKMKVWVLFLSRIPLNLPAWILLGGWVGFQVFMYLTTSGATISWAAHVGGAIAGALLVLVLRRRGVPLFDREVVVPAAVDLEPQVALPKDVKPASWGRNAR